MKLKPLKSARHQSLVAPSRGRGLKRQKVETLAYVFKSPLHGGVD